MNALRARLRREGDRGLTLIELLVTMILLAVVSTLVVTAVAQSVRILGQTDDEALGLSDAKIILDRLGRDIREARAVTCDGGLADLSDPTSADPDCAAHLQLWIDANSNYVEDPTEVITWRLETNGAHFDVWRTAGTGAGGTPVIQQRQASSLIVRMAFTYGPPGAPVPVEDAEQVNLRMRYDAIRDRGTGDREVAFSARLRNKG
ncbi:PulJ/GspJ family protein [Cellulomonas carbonis]|uniref:Prepilin-type N-terminal cleavage/methylation domain-containing protein n=1 Tax=Cellulomonas carbonis T26 TaxID=947969 RepID=A0A0A0BQ64_9CELL|nr:prepilin-type N-terminal cleavage/methylation domain-containing protein [Cellulomonas carbonis]KGM10111.1 hypothetical protein N868_16620 [Cellulomonas carbonis T26]GGB94071.1 hypothetical protein GCM10010972_03440 [Cellulomonas carbonis]